MRSKAIFPPPGEEEGACFLARTSGAGTAADTLVVLLCLLIFTPSSFRLAPVNVDMSPRDLPAHI